MHLGMRWCGQIFAPMSPCGGSNSRCCTTKTTKWVDATAIPFPIQIDLWYEFIEMV